MTDEQYLDYCRKLLTEFARRLESRTRDLPAGHPLRALATGFLSLADSGTELYTRGPELVIRLFDTHADFAPTFPRQLLWFFGGDCLHYLADEEIEEYQRLDDLRLAAAQRGETFDMAPAQAKVLNLH